MVKNIIIIIMIILVIWGIYTMIEDIAVCNQEWWVIVRGIYNYVCVQK